MKRDSTANLKLQYLSSPCDHCLRPAGCVRLAVAVLVTTIALPLRVTAAESGAVTPTPETSPAAGLGLVLASRPRVDQPLSIDQAVAIALRESPVIRGAVQEVEAAAGRLDAARAERRPWVSVHTFLGGGSAPNIVGSTEPVQPRAAMGLPGGRFLDANVSLMVPLFTGGRLKSMVRQSRALKGASEAELLAMRQEVTLMVRMAYREAQARRSFVQVYQAALEQNRERQRIDQIAYEQEKIPRFYLFRNAAEVANAEQMLTNAQRDLETRLIQLKTLMGVRLDSRVELTEPLEFRPSRTLMAASMGPRGEETSAAPGASPAEADLTRLLAVAERNRPELAAAVRRLDVGRAEVGVARSTYRPQITIGLMGDWTKIGEESPFGGSTVAIVGSLPVLDGGLRRAQVRTARAEARKLEEERQRVALQVGQEVTTALLDLRAAEKNVQTAQAGVVAAEEDNRVSTLRYTSGKGINVEVLDALAAQVRAQSNHVQALFEYNVAQDRLGRALGLLPPSGTQVPSSP